MAERRQFVVERSYVVNTTPEVVFDALGDEVLLGSCLNPLERVRIAPQAGGRIGFRDPELGVVIGRVGEYVRGVRLTWRMAQNWPSVLSFDFTADTSGCHVEVIQSGFGALRGVRDDIDQVFSDRWDEWMEAIKASVEG